MLCFQLSLTGSNDWGDGCELVWTDSGCNPDSVSDTLFSFENTPFDDCMALCQAVTDCAFITLDEEGECYLLRSCDSFILDYPGYISSPKCDDSGTRIEIDSDSIGINIFIEEHKWTCTLFRV